jgi:hypothetical protein
MSDDYHGYIVVATIQLLAFDVGVAANEIKQDVCESIRMAIALNIVHDRRPPIANTCDMAV